MSTYMAKPDDIKREWLVIDAEEKTLGRMATKIAMVLQGKHKPMYTPHMDTGDYVVVVNAGKVRLTGNKLQDKLYHRHSEHPGGLKSVTYGELMEKNPEKVIELAVKRMLPKNKLGRKMFKKLKVYADAKHPHTAQQPKELEL